MTTQRQALLRVCASCEWIFTWMSVETKMTILSLHPEAELPSEACPKCSSGSYGAHSVYGKDCYKFHKSQKPYHEKQKINLHFIQKKENKDETTYHIFR